MSVLSISACISRSLWLDIIRVDAHESNFFFDVLLVFTSSRTRTSQFSKLQIFAKSAIFEISIREMTTSILESADSDEMNSSLRGTQNKRNAHLGVILESLIFQKFKIAKITGFFKIPEFHDIPIIARV